MRVVEYSLILCSFFLNINGLNCRSEGGPKENELKKIYNVCMKQQNKINNSNNRGDLDQDWKESRRYGQWSQDNVGRNRGNANKNYGMEDRGRDDENRMNNRDISDEQYKMNRQDKQNKNRMQYNERDGNQRMHSRDEKQNGDSRSQRNNGVNDRNDFFQNENFNGYNNQYSTQPSRRYKRERRIELNSGKRSQYNPNPQRFPGYEEKYKDIGKNSSESNSTSEDDSKACAVHCILEKLRVIGDNGNPDRYLVTHIMTKDIKDEELKDFLQESIEECFQLLDNENPDDKCEFSKNLMMCLSEKGRANCDDWKEDFQF